MLLFDAGVDLTRTLLYDLTQRLIDSRRVRKDPGNIGLQDDDICTPSVLLRVLTDHRVAEIVLIQHFYLFILFLAHNLFSHVIAVLALMILIPPLRKVCTTTNVCCKPDSLSINEPFFCL